MSRKVLFFDVDGTLRSNETKSIPQSTVNALQKAKEKGHLIFVNTGRGRYMLPPELLPIGFDGIVCGCGTYVDYKDKVLMIKKLHKERRRELVKALKINRGAAILESWKGIALIEIEKNTNATKRIRDSFIASGMKIDKVLEDGDYTFNKFVAFTDQNTNLDQLFDEVGKDMDIVHLEENAYECVPKGYTKASGIKYILDELELSLEDTYVFGDSGNDLSMFQYCPNAVAMGYHDKVLAPYTTFVTKTVEEDGIEYALKELNLI